MGSRNVTPDNWTVRGNENLWLSLTIRILRANISAAPRRVSRGGVGKSRASYVEVALELILSCVQ
ncbi:hypothetical protein MES4922_180020 [Mesorhizobium ventifaucium]|uniref:Uncharacterized protein n=1 Tax=Mesorhizobium ventifaucium TaxID=666020 RepID=A0ABN8JLX2_9HYPH|nr:hypothetical protein MES4922_180020 [Mesorhizobium ventifaucium]